MDAHRLLLVCVTAASLSAAVSSPSAASNPLPADGLWTRTAPTRSLHATPPAATFQVDLARLRRRLATAPTESRGFGRAAEITLPMPDGELARLRVVESPILAGEAALRHPDARTYLAIGDDDRSLRARLDVTDLGVRAIAFTSRGTVVVDPATSVDAGSVTSSWLSDAALSDFECEVRELYSRAQAAAPTPVTNFSWGSDLRSIRFILMATGEFTQALGGQALADARLLTIMNRMNAFFERDLAVRLIAVQLVAFPNPSTDPYWWPGGYAELLERNTAVVDSMFGSSSYDKGAIVTKIAGTLTRGIGYLPGLCAEGAKAGSVAATHDPGALNVELTLGHELGHGFGGYHTQDRNCNRTAISAVEPGSGLTILCSMPAACPIDVQPVREDFYHVKSLELMTAVLAESLSCGTTTAAINSAPTADAGPDVTIPRSTPFVLTGSGSDADAGDALTYTWDQVDIAPTSAHPVLGPVFRWRLPTAEPVRYFPPLGTVLFGTPEVYETPPSVDRLMHFRLVVRDNHPGCGGVAWDEKVVTVSGAPFAVTFPGGNILDSASPFTVTWDVGGGSVAANVNVLLSTDDGASWLPLAMGIANDGSEQVSHPVAVMSTQCRVKVEAVDNVFYSISPAFTLEGDPTPVLMLQFESETLADGIAIRWRFADPGHYAAIVVERSDDGARWTRPTGERTDLAGVSTFLDRTVSAGREYLYRLQATSHDGERLAFGPIAAGTAPGGLAISGVAPNPSSGTVRIDYTVPRAAAVRVDVLDVQGRVVAVLLSGDQPAGRHQRVWSGAGSRGVRPGLYFVRLESAGVTRVQTLVLAP